MIRQNQDDENRELLMNHTGCMYAFVKGGKYRIITSDNKQTEGILDPKSVAYDESKTRCPTENSPGKLTFGFDINDAYFKSIHLSMRIHVNETLGFWKIISVNITLFRKDKKRVLPAMVKDMQARLNNSYSCSYLELKNANAKQTQNETDKQPPSISLILYRFQLQPFAAGKKTIFVESDDCSVWLSIPEISGLLLVIFVIAVVSLGVHFLLNIQINDFNDVKEAVKFTQLQFESNKLKN